MNSRGGHLPFFLFPEKLFSQLFLCFFSLALSKLLSQLFLCFFSLAFSKFLLSDCFFCLQFGTLCLLFLVQPLCSSLMPTPFLFFTLQLLIHRCLFRFLAQPLYFCLIFFPRCASSFSRFNFSSFILWCSSCSFICFDFFYTSSISFAFFLSFASSDWPSLTGLKWGYDRPVPWPLSSSKSCRAIKFFR